MFTHYTGQPPPAYRAPPQTPAALPIALTRPKRSALAATNYAAIQNSVQRDATTTRLGGKKKTYPRNWFRLSEPNPNPNRLSDSYPALVH